ncbi:GTP-binding protein [Halobacteriales archaeon SW_7_68_16]|nr:MAG: GTP-binding protein [Halobacteriales archaeon SW_7_68_16]
MTQPFEDLPTTSEAEALVDTAFSRAARSGKAKTGLDGQRSMLQTAANVLSDNLDHVATSWPDFDTLHPFYYELADAVAGVDALRQHLSETTWASRKVDEIKTEYQSRLRDDVETAAKHRRQAFARMGDVVREVADNLAAIEDARADLARLPDVRPDEPTVVVAGYPNVGKTSLVNAATRADNEVATYPYTTTGLAVGHFERDHVRYQLVDTPGLLDRPAEERNEIESQTVTALTHAADAVLFLVDASEACGYGLDAQLALRDEVRARFPDAGFHTVCNKADRSRDVTADHYVSVADGEGIDDLLAAAVATTAHEPELPFES